MTLNDKTLFISGGSRGHRPGDRAARRARRRERRADREDGRAASASSRAPSSPRPRRSRPPAARRCRSWATSATSPRSRRRVAATVERFGGIDVCVNNASRDRPVRHRGAGDEALRPDAGHQHARHVRRQPRLHPAPAAGREPAHPDAVAADQPRAPLARPAHRLHDRQVRHEPVRARLRRGAPRGRDRLERALAAHADRDRRGAEPARRRRGDGRVAQAASSYADAAYAVITRPSRECTGNTFLCEDVLAEEGVTDMDVYAYVPGATPQVDLFVDHV